MKKNLVMVFGVFDRLHPGHRAFLRQAKKYGKKLIVAVARDSVVRKLKNKKPQQTERQRTMALRKIQGISKAVLGDRKQSSYSVVKKHKPGVVCLGYDQNLLAKDLRKRIEMGNLPHIKIMKLRAYYSKKRHSFIP